MPVVFTVQSGQMSKDGFQFYCSENGVWLTKYVPPKYLKDIGNLLLLDTAGIYEDEYSNYISPDDDSAISYYMYNSQRLERDAEKYSNASVVDYYEQICSYLESN